MNSETMLIFTFVFLALVIMIFAYYVYYIKKSFKNTDKNDNALLMIQNQISEISRVLDVKLGESNKTSQNQFIEISKILRDVTEQTTKVYESNKQVVSITDQLKNLQDILKNPKQRGVLGEYYLEIVLKNILPPSVYQMQYNLGVDKKTGKELIVDAVVFVKDKIIPIDSKFSLENYNRMLEAQTKEEREKFANAFVQDLKMRVDETSKYIKPEKNTTEFAFMFIPSEAIYYDLLVNKIGIFKDRNIIEYASGDKKVIIVSPTTFLAYLQTVLQGLKALQIEKSAKEIQKHVRNLEKHLIAYQTYLDKLGNHLSTTVNTYNFASKEFGKIDKDVLKITEGERKTFEPELLEKPITFDEKNK